MNSLEHPDKFVNRHLGPREEDIAKMLEAIGVESVEKLIQETVPQSIRLSEKLEIDPPISEYKFIEHLKDLADRNIVYKSYIGLGYHPTHTPAVIQRNILENPGWYTQYTPYQAEISQGRLEALMNFQTAVIDLTGLPIANASLLDEGTAAAEAMHLAYGVKGKEGKETVFVDRNCHPQTIDIIKTRAWASGLKVTVGDAQAK